MPVYDYKCQECGLVFEKFLRTMAAADSVHCEKCGSAEVQKLITCCAISSGGKSESTGSSSHSIPVAVVRATPAVPVISLKSTRFKAHGVRQTEGILREVMARLCLFRLLLSFLP